MTLPISFFNHDAQAGGFFPQAHVGFDIIGIGNRQNTLIEGIRGTGKTHILKMLRRYHLENFAATRVLPIYVSLAQINEYVKKEPDEFRVQLYARIVDACIETLEASKDYLADDQSRVSSAFQKMARVLGIEGLTHAVEIDTAIQEIKDLAEELLFQLSYDLTAEQLKSVGNSERTNTSKISGSAKLIAGVANAGIAEENIESQKDGNAFERSVQLMGSRLVHNNAAEFIIRFLQQVQVTLDLNYSLILLDECSEASPEAQVEIFRFFKAIRGSTSVLTDREDCAFFVGTVYPRSQTHYPNRKNDGFSFEPGQDCAMEFVQWDETDLETYLQFFEKMMISRAEVVLDYDRGFERFIQEYFDSETTFRLAVFCANGIPRRFWEITKRAYDAGTKKISWNRLRIAIQEIVGEQILGHTSLSAEDHDTIQYIIKILTQKNEAARVKNKEHNSKLHPQGVYFSILPSNAHKLETLVMQGASHDKSRMKSRRQSLRPHPIFALDIALAFSFRAIPEKGFADVAAADFPRCTANGFASAASFEPPKGQKLTIGKNSESKNSPTPEYVVPSKTGSGVASSDAIEATGVVTYFFPNGYGFVSVNDGGPDAYVQRREMMRAVEAGVERGTAVRFTLSENERGRLAQDLVVYDNHADKPTDAMKARLSDFIQQQFDGGDSVDLGNLALVLKNHFGDAVAGTGWLGYGKLSWMLQALDLDNLEIDTSVPPGHLRRKS